MRDGDGPPREFVADKHTNMGREFYLRYL